MSPDPFDALRDANPVPSDSLPPAPMGEAERIIGATRRRGFDWPSWAVATAAALAVLVAGGAWMVWLGRGDEEITAADPTTSVAATATTATTVMQTAEATVFMLTATEAGPVVVPVPRAAVAPGDPEGAEYTAAAGALAALLAGPTSTEVEQGLTTAIPAGIDGPPLSVHKVVTNSAGNTATVFVPHFWMASGYPTPDGLAQIVFTLTAIEGIDGVEFALGDDRAPGGVIAGSGTLIPADEFADHPSVDEVVTRLTYEGWMPLAFVESPPFGAELALPFDAHGVVNSIGNQIRLTLEVDERTLWQETVTATCGTAWSECRGEWDWSTWRATIPDVGHVGGAMLIAEAFGSGIEIIDRRAYPLTVASSGLETPGTTTTLIEAGPAVPSELAVYMLMDADTTHTTPGPHLVPAAWTTAILSAPLTHPPRQATEWLLQGPLPGWHESVSPVSTAIPEDTRLLGLEIADGVATVDLSSDFVTGGGSLSMTARLAQVVFTLTQFDEIDGVRISIEGTPTTVFGGEGVIVDDVITRDRFEDLLPPIMIETPMYWSYENDTPLQVSGTANVFEATVSLVLTDGDGLIIWEGFATATCGTGCRGDWSVEIPYSLDTDQLGAVIVWEESARDGSQTNVREHPVWLRATSETICSGADVPADLPAQPELPGAVADTREALFTAARTCDWAALRNVIGADAVRLHFGEPPLDPVEWLREAEGDGGAPMAALARTLRLPAGPGVENEREPGSSPSWVWPAAFGAGPWDEVSEADRQALLEMYTPDDLVSFEEFGAFIGYRVGIGPDGTWQFFVAGD